MVKEFKTLSNERERLSEYLREQGLSINICGDILRMVINQDKEFIKLLKECFSETFLKAYTTDMIHKEIDKLAGSNLI